MATIRHISQRIKGIRNIQHITKAMKMVATARLKRAQMRLLAARPYAQKMADLTLDLAILHADGSNPLLKRKSPSQRLLIVVFTGDRGLCGGFHEHVAERGLALARELGPETKPAFYMVGRQGAHIMRRLGIDLVKIYEGSVRGVTYAAAKTLADELIGMYCQDGYARIDLVYSRFQTALLQKPRVFHLLPIVADLAKRQPPKGDYLFEPSSRELFEGLLADYVASEVFRAFVECETGELGARMTAMANATDNAGEMIARLTLDYNRTRQALITREISEIMGGMETLKQE